MSESDQTRLEETRTTVAVCMTCGGRGVLRNTELGPGRPHGTIDPCPACVQQFCGCDGTPPYQRFDENRRMLWCACAPWRKRAQRTDSWLSHTGAEEKFKWTFLEDFQDVAADRGHTTSNNGGYFRSVVRGMLEYVQEGDEPQEGLLFWGKPGCGKSLLASIALNELIIRQGNPGLFLNLGQHFQSLRDTFSQSGATYGQSREIMDALAAIPLLVIDELDASRDTEWEQEMLYHLINRRYEAHRLTLVTMNKDPGSYLDDLSLGRIASRLHEMCDFHEVTLPDWRRRPRAGRQAV